MARCKSYVEIINKLLIDPSKMSVLRLSFAVRMKWPLFLAQFEEKKSKKYQNSTAGRTYWFKWSACEDRVDQG